MVNSLLASFNETGMEILKFPHPLLFEATVEVAVFGEELRVLLDSMWETMKASNGLGLAANQVSLPLRMFVMEGPQGRINIVNPRIVSRSAVAANLKEGCLSAPGEFIIIPDRSEWVQIECQDETGAKRTHVFRGLHSVCVQHEMEHLDGKGFILNKSLPKTDRKALAKKWL